MSSFKPVQQVAICTPVESRLLVRGGYFTQSCYHFRTNLQTIKSQIKKKNDSKQTSCLIYCNIAIYDITLQKMAIRNKIILSSLYFFLLFRNYVLQSLCSAFRAQGDVEICSTKETIYAAPMRMNICIFDFFQLLFALNYPTMHCNLDYPTEHFTNPKPQNPPIDVSQLSLILRVDGVIDWKMVKYSIRYPTKCISQFQPFIYLWWRNISSGIRQKREKASKQNDFKTI